MSTCSSCKYFLQTGKCCRFPPAIFTANISLLPSVLEKGFCGEFVPKEQKAAKPKKKISALQGGGKE